MSYKPLQSNWPPIQTSRASPADRHMHQRKTSASSYKEPNTPSAETYMAQEPWQTEIINDGTSGSCYFPSAADSYNASQYLEFASPQLNSYTSNPRHSHPTDRSFHDFLTPEPSVEHPHSDYSTHSTPGLGGQPWEQEFGGLSNLGARANTRVFNEGHPSSHFADSLAENLLGISGQQQASTLALPVTSQLLSPQLTTTPSPPDPSNSQMNPLSSTKVTPTPLAMSHLEQRPQTLHARTITGSGAHTPEGKNGRAVSPALVVSSYSRGDSPKRSDFPRSRSSSRPSQTGLISKRRLSHELSDVEDPSDVSPRQRLSLEGNERSHTPTRRDRRSGIQPGSRGDEVVTSLKDLEEKRHLQEKNADVETWLAKSEAGSPVSENSSDGRLRRRSSRKNRSQTRKAKPIKSDLESETVQHVSTPGPGLILDEDSGDDESEASFSHSSVSNSESPPAQLNPKEDFFPEDEYFPAPAALPQEPEEQEPLPRQFFRASPWQDPFRTTVFAGSKEQPDTSNAAIMKYDRQAAQFETASRAATWGTRRRLSDSEVTSIVEGSKVRHLSLSKHKSRDRSGSLLNKARGLIPHRSNSHLKKKKTGDAIQEETATEGHKKRGNSLSGFANIQLSPSLGKSFSSHLSTGSALMAITGQLAAVGRSTSAAPDHDHPSSPFHIMKRNRSKSEIPKTSTKGNASPGLTELMTKHGGPPILTLASPLLTRSSPLLPKQQIEVEEGDDDDDDDEDDFEPATGVKMDFSIRAKIDAPSVEGFKSHAQQLNPRIEPFLAGRIGQEQILRYKRLLDIKVKHERAVGQHKCASGKHCFALDGEATLLSPRANAQFQVGGHDIEVGDDTVGDAIVTTALFPPGIPLPPVKRLPAEFECPLCFKVKKFHKPSDWTKHVHEDTQPFACTYPNCSEPKTFKRKADWVRHENERHRHLEWWSCDNALDGCTHVCYRKDNFLQHLVREHKVPEPKVRSRGQGSSRTLGAGHETEEIWRLMDLCRHETPKKPSDEICKFCGNMCSSWKKLSCHLASHMCQVALPVLELVEVSGVTADTIISPVEQNMSTPLNRIASQEQTLLSPFSMNVTPHHQASPAVYTSLQLHDHLSEPGWGDGQAYQSETLSPHEMSGGQMPAQRHFVQSPTGPYATAIPPYSSAFPRDAMAATYPPPHAPLRRSPMQGAPSIPRSQPLQQEGYNVGLGAYPLSMYEASLGQPLYVSPVDGTNPYGSAFENQARFRGGANATSTPMVFESVTGTGNMQMANGQTFEEAPGAEYFMPGQAPHNQGYQY